MDTCNDVEVGTGRKDPDQFDATGLDTDNIVRVLKETGFKFVILVAKHHDGFCIWPSRFTNHSVVRSFKWRENMKKLGKSYDAVEEFSKSCTKYDMPMGLYLSPSDLNNENYGKAEDNYHQYNDYMKNQLVELLSNPKYGNKERITEIWYDGAKFGSGLKTQVYYYEKWLYYIEALEPGCLVNSR